MLLPLFIYGTLHPQQAPAEIAATVKLLTPLGKASIQGRRYELGEYPGVVLSDDLRETVSGEVFLLPEGLVGVDVLARIDAYEDFRPFDSENSLFLRKVTSAEMDSGLRQSCWVYVYNRQIG